MSHIEHLEAVTEASQSVNANLIGGVIGAVISILIVAAVVLLIVFILYRRYGRTTEPSLKKVGLVYYYRHARVQFLCLIQYCIFPEIIFVCTLYAIATNLFLFGCSELWEGEEGGYHLYSKGMI